MKSEDVMRHPLNVLSEALRRRYFGDGYLILSDYVPELWLGQLRNATAMYDDAGNLVVRVRDEDLAWLEDDFIGRPTGGPGTIILLDCRTVHGSTPNSAASARPLLLTLYSSADSFAFTPSPITSPYQGDIVRGRFDLRPCELPSDWRAGYRTAWTYQKEEERRRQSY